MRIGAVAVVCACLLVSAGCTSTVIPKPVESDVPSFDTGGQNSGFLGWMPDGKGIITPRARDRYNLLIDEYGGRFSPKIGQDHGILPGPIMNGETTFTIRQDALEKFITMNRWRKSGL